jgi:hypothetical protein
MNGTIIILHEQQFFKSLSVKTKLIKSGNKLRMHNLMV